MDDQTIARGLKQGSSHALSALADRYRSGLVAYAQRLLRDRAEAEDLAQEVLLKARHATGLKNDAALGGWLYAVSYTLAIDRLRRRERQARALVAIPQPQPIEAVSTTAERREERERVLAALHHLEEPYRTAVSLRYLKGFEFVEIARQMGTIERTARTWVGRGLTMLRQKLGGMR